MIRLIVAFASTRHAHAAIAFLHGASFEVHWSGPEAGGALEFATVEFVVHAHDVRRLRILVAGLHGIVIKTEPAVAVAGIPA